MLFSQHNGLAHAVSDQSEVEVLQNLACGIGPRVDGIAASLSLPQSMGAFSTSGAQGACGGRGQQQEQHTPTTTRGLGSTMLPTDVMTKLIATAPTTTKLAIDPAKLALVRAATAAPMEFKVMATALPGALPSAQPTPPAASMSPAAATPPTVPPGTITAFDASINMWRVAVPPGASFGIFGATGVFVEQAPEMAPPPGATQTSLTQLKKKTGTLPLYKRWELWAAIGGVAVLGTGTVLLIRRRKHA